MSSDWDAATYDRISDPQYRWATSVIQRLDPAARSILDAGCGPGRVTQLVLTQFPDAQMVAVDSSENMVAEARRRLEPFADRVTVIHADLTEPIPLGAPVDAVLSTAVFHWIDDHPRLFGNLVEAVRPGGQLVAQWGGKGNVRRLLDITRELGGPDLTGNFTTADDTRAELEAAGFVDVRTWIHPDPADFDTRAELEQYLGTICLRSYVNQLEPAERSRFVGAVADRMRDRRVDYVRINAVARRTRTVESR